MQYIGFIMMIIFEYNKCTRRHTVKFLTVLITNLIQGLLEGKPVTFFH
jgi:hypothetical protein